MGRNFGTKILFKCNIDVKLIRVMIKNFGCSVGWHLIDGGEHQFIDVSQCLNDFTIILSFKKWHEVCHWFYAMICQT